jgi:hypothetical protein
MYLLLSVLRQNALDKTTADNGKEQPPKLAKSAVVGISDFTQPRRTRCLT